MTVDQNHKSTQEDCAPEETLENYKTISLPKVSLIRILTFLFKICLDREFIIIQIFTFLFEFLSIYAPFVEGNIINAITSDKSLESMLYWGKIRVSILFGEFFLYKLKKKLNVLDYEESFFGTFHLKFYKKILKKDMEFHDSISLARIQDIYKNDFQALYTFIPVALMNKVRTIFTTFFSLFMLINISFELFLIELVSLLANVYVTSKFTDINWEEYQKISSKQNEIFSESFLNIKLIKCFSLEDKILKIFRNYSKHLNRMDVQSRNLYSSYGSKSFLYYLTLAKNIYAGKLVIEGKLGLGDFTKFRLIAGFLNNGGSQIFNFAKDVKKNYRKVLNIFELMDYKKEEPKGSFVSEMTKIFSSKISKKKGALKKNLDDELDFEGNIEFRNVDFRYPTRPKAQILNQLSFKINKGDVVAFVGSSGSGKSTVAALFHRLYDPENGEVLIDNRNIKQIDLELLHSKIGYVSQEPYLFTLTIKENILFGLNKVNYTPEEEEKLEEKLKNIIKKANCEFVYDKSIFPDGLDTMVSGNNLSGGQKQRIAIARALMKEVNFLVFDEATSALDANSEAEVQKAIDEIIKEAKITTIIIAHRLSTIKNCHKIFVLNKGKVVEEGTHKELKKLNGFYRELINKQIEAYEKEEQETLLRKKTSRII